MAIHEGVFRHPHDTIVSAGFRFVSELIAWIACPWAASLVSAWLAFPVLIILVGLPSVFSTVNDKRNVVVATPGGIRIIIELLLYSVAIITPWFVWPDTLSIISVLIVVTSLFMGYSRFKWLLRGAPQKG
jgi:hypothetical protein